MIMSSRGFTHVTCCGQGHVMISEKGGLFTTTTSDRKSKEEVIENFIGHIAIDLCDRSGDLKVVVLSKEGALFLLSRGLSLDIALQQITSRKILQKLGGFSSHIITQAALGEGFLIIVTSTGSLYRINEHNGQMKTPILLEDLSSEHVVSIAVTGKNFFCMLCNCSWRGLYMVL